MQQLTKKHDTQVQVSVNLKKMLEKETINLSLPISFIYSSPVNQTTKHQLPSNIVVNNNLSTIGENEFLPMLGNLSLGRINSNIQFNTTFPCNHSRQDSFSNAKTMANMLEETGLKGNSKGEGRRRRIIIFLANPTE